MQTSQPERGRVRAMRSDAAENQERLLAAAVTTMLREGRSVPLATIAAEAKVGVATLYRRYPNREALFEALEVRAYKLVIATVRELLQTAEPGIQLIDRFLDRTIAHRSQLVLPFHGAPESGSAESRMLRAELARLTAEMVSRGHADGSVRSDVSAFEVVVFGVFVSQPLGGIAEWEPVAAAEKKVFLRGIAG